MGLIILLYMVMRVAKASGLTHGHLKIMYLTYSSVSRQVFEILALLLCSVKGL